ncbi:Histidine kinase [Flavobacteriaceae bacterium MAR_2010_188]|nr:Histidine kinase [Flavobacteriaceae bacterium MAR_2010_188]
MNRSFLFFSVILFLSSVSWAQSSLEQDKISTYFYNLTTLDFQKIQEIQSHDFDLSHLYQLRDVIYYRDSIIYYKKEYDSIVKHPLNRCANLLYKGYDKIFTSGNETSVLNDFKKAYQLSKEIDNPDLQKFCIFSLLEFYSHEILQSNHNYQEYLDELNSLEKLPEEEFLLNLYRMLFHSHAKYLPPQFYGIAERNDELINTQEINAALISRFNVQKAYGFEVSKMMDSASFYYKQVIKNNNALPYNKHLVFTSYLRLSEMASNQSLYADAIDYIDKAVNFSNVSDTLKGEFYLLRFKSRVLAQKGDFEPAYKDLKKSLDIEYDLDYRTNSLQISDLEIQLRTAEKEKLLLIEQQKKRRNRNIALALGGLILAIGLISTLVYKNINKKRLLAEKSEELQKEKLTTILKDQELNYIDALIEGQEKERQRVANELHDDLGSVMANLKLHFTALKNRPSKELFSKTDNLLDSAYSKIRGVAHAKNSGVMAQEGLIKSLRNMAMNISSSQNLELQIIDHGMDERLENSLELTIFRIIQELVTNIIKHAKATEATIHITRHSDVINLLIEDNGSGFSTKNISKQKGMGIHGIDKKLETLGGTMSIESENTTGTSIIIDIPI